MVHLLTAVPQARTKIDSIALDLNWTLTCLRASKAESAASAARVLQLQEQVVALQAALYDSTKTTAREEALIAAHEAELERLKASMQVQINKLKSKRQNSFEGIDWERDCKRRDG